MMKRSIVLGLAAAAFMLAPSLSASAGVASSALGGIANSHTSSAATQVRWLCGPYACHYVPNYAGVVYAVPASRAWAPPPQPHCYYKKALFNWKLICP